MHERHFLGLSSGAGVKDCGLRVLRASKADKRVAAALQQRPLLQVI